MFNVKLIRASFVENVFKLKVLRRVCVRYSGYQGSSEWIQVVGSIDRDLDLFAKNYAPSAQDGVVTWSGYGGVGDCAEETGLTLAVHVFGGNFSAFNRPSLYMVSKVSSALSM